MIIKGTGSGSITVAAYNIAATIKSISVFNRTASGVSIGVGVVAAGVTTFFYSATLTATNTDGSCSYRNVNIAVEAGWQIIISASGSTGYCILIE
ncbi:MAG: hypothetical protein V4547_16945 [Bacteroidota bacterium]